MRGLVSFVPMPSLRKVTALFATVALWLGVAGCANSPRTPASPTHIVKVNATATEAPKKGTAFTIVANRVSVDDSTLLYAEAVRVVMNALQTKGLHAAPDVTKADVIVELEYGMAPPRVAGRPLEPVEPPKPVRADVPVETNVANLMSTARGPLEKRLVLTAREAKKKTDDDPAPPRTLWTVELTTIDLSNDLRKYFPILASVALDQMGADSGGAQLIRIAENDKTVALLRQSR